MKEPSTNELTIALCGDLMIGRGIDQILPEPCPPILYESYVKSALDYVRLTEQQVGPLPRPVDLAYPWGDMLDELAVQRPDIRIVNLETAVTRSEQAWPGKGIHYRVSPQNAAMLSLAGIDACVLANNHVLDWGRSGLAETLETLHALGLHSAGAGLDREAAEAPAEIAIGAERRLRLFSVAMESSGVPASWAATDTCSGIALLPDLGSASLARLRERIRAGRREGDLVILSIHWGGNWGFDISEAQHRFAHGLVEDGLVDIVHGHSSHHVKGIEVHRGRPILYGCGDFLDDYEAIGGHRAYRGELGLLYFVTLDASSGALARLRMTPTRVRRLRIERAGEQDVRWLEETLRRESEVFATHVVRTAGNRLELVWDRP